MGIYVMVHRVRTSERLVGIQQKYSFFYIFRGITTKRSKVEREFIFRGNLIFLPPP